MRIAISTDDNRGLDAVVSPHFGRCPYYTFVDVEDHEVKNVVVEPNPFYGRHSPGQVPGFINSRGAQVMIAGGMGMRAIGFFQQYGIEPVTGAMGTARMALEQYLQGELRGSEPCLESKEHRATEALPEGEYEQDEVGRLREEIEALQRQLTEVTARLEKLS